jgi:hypothetical protein
VRLVLLSSDSAYVCVCVFLMGYDRSSMWLKTQELSACVLLVGQIICVRWRKLYRG